MNKIMFVSVSKDAEHKLSDSDFADVADRTIFIKVSDNIKPLTKVYNEHLAIARSTADIDTLVLMHADVKVDIKHLVDHIDECYDKYEMMFLCGTDKATVSASPLNWFTSSSVFPGHRWGCVTHGELNNQRSFFSSDRAEITDHSISFGDGLCIIFTKRALATDIRFDEQFMFDQYDTDISMQAILNYNMRLGCIVEQSLQHYSVGRSILTEDFLKHEISFRKKWNLDIPKGSKLEQLISAGLQ